MTPQSRLAGFTFPITTNTAPLLPYIDRCAHEMRAFDAFGTLHKQNLTCVHSRPHVIIHSPDGGKSWTKQILFVRFYAGCWFCMTSSISLKWQKDHGLQSTNHKKSTGHTDCRDFCQPPKYNGGEWDKIKHLRQATSFVRLYRGTLVLWARFSVLTCWCLASVMLTMFAILQ